MRWASLRVGGLRERPSQPGWLFGPDGAERRTSRARTIVDVITWGGLLAVRQWDQP